jgi:hypothetical protein
MMTIVRTDGAAQATEDGPAARLDDLACEGARRVILAALEVEVEEYVTRHRAAMPSWSAMGRHDRGA